MRKDHVYIPKLRNMTSLYLLRGEQILLLYRQGKSIVRNMWVGSAGGHFEPNELRDPESCVLRELREELCLGLEHISNFSLRYATMRHMDGEIRQNYYFFATLNDDIADNLLSTEGTLQWFNLNQILDLQMPITARHIIDHYVATGRFTSQLYGVVVNDSQSVFTPL